MTTILGPRQTTAEAYFCPKCQSPVEVPVTLLGVPGDVRCSCGWYGMHTELAVSKFKHEFASDEEIANRMSSDLRNLLAKTAGSSYAAFLLKWGFLDQPVQRAQLARYLQDIAKAVVPAIIETRKKLVEEKS
jgi:hypothetical protein